MKCIPFAARFEVVHIKYDTKIFELRRRWQTESQRILDARILADEAARKLVNWHGDAAQQGDNFAWTLAEQAPDHRATWRRATKDSAASAVISLQAMLINVPFNDSLSVRQAQLRLGAAMRALDVVNLAAGYRDILEECPLVFGAATGNGPATVDSPTVFAGCTQRWFLCFHVGRIRS